MVDAHAHVWVEAQPGHSADMPCLDDEAKARQELTEFYSAGGRTLVDCQPAFTGRNGLRLRQLAVDTGVKIVASTGFHLQKYYPSGHGLFTADENTAAQFFIRELTEGLVETCEETPLPAGQIKAACPARPEDWPRALMAGAAQAALTTGAAVQIHTEKGAGAEAILDFFQKAGLDPHRIVLAHMDKRADFGLHRMLVQAGALVEYDTFSREKYDPEENVWPLIEKMMASGLEDGIALANDLAYKREWHAYGGSPGLESLLTCVLPRLNALGLAEPVIKKILGGNIAHRLARARS